MESLMKKTVTSKRGFKYTYYIVPPKADKPTLLLQHGFPDEALLWDGLVADYLVPAGYGIVAPDMLGSNLTAKPTDPAAYKFRGMTADLVDILDAEGIDKVISTGHDWGSRAAHMFYNLHPERTIGLILVNVAPFATDGKPFDLDAVNERTQKVFGYGVYWYWKLFAAEDGAKLIEDNLDTFFEIGHDPSVWPETYTAKDGLRNALINKHLKTKPLPYATAEFKQRWVGRLARDGLEGSTCWYKSHVSGLQDTEVDPSNSVIKVPSLFVGYDSDRVCRDEVVHPFIEAGLAPKMTHIRLEGHHYGLLENPQAFGASVLGWLDKRF